jgi:DNA-binding CsgD family transcriptional regulator
VLPEDPALVERDSDLASLVAALARPPAMAVVEGEPGIGKSRLVREALADRALADRQRLLGHTRPVRAPSPLGPVIEALATAKLPSVRRLSALSGVLRTVLPDLADMLPPAPPSLDDAQLVRHRLLRATAELLSNLGPMILVLEDLQWADEATIELLGMISARPPPELSVVITYSSSALPLSPGLTALLTGSLGSLTAAHVHLSPLSAPAAGQLARAILGNPETGMPRELADLLYERNGGVPLVVREDVLLLRRRGLLNLVDAEWAFGSGGEAPEADPRAVLSAVIPSAVGTDIIARTGSLGAAARAALDAAAVLAESAEPELVAKVAGMDAEQTTAALGDATRRGLLRDHASDSTAVTFRHELARLAIYQAISGPRRRRLHAVAAQELAGTGRTAMAVRVAEHHRRAGDIQVWVRSAEAAAEIAADSVSFGAAHSYLRDILQAGAVAEERRVEVAIKLGWTALGGVDQIGTTAALLTAAQTCSTASPAQRAELRLLRIWPFLDTIGSSTDMDVSVAEMHAAISDLTRRPDLQAIALAVLATPTRLPDLDVPAQMAHLSQARAALDQTTNSMAHAVVLTTVAHMLLAIGNPAGWTAVDALPTHGDRLDVNRQIIRSLLNAADAALHLGHYPRSLELVKRGLRLAADVRLHTHDPRLRVTGLRVRWTMGDIGAEDQVSRFASDPHVHSRLHSRLLSAQIRTGRGQFDVARRTLRAVAEEACGVGELSIAAHAVAELNRAGLTVADRRLGHALARQVLDALALKQIWVSAAPLVPFAQIDLVRAVLPSYRSGLEGRDSPLARAALSFAEARVSEQDGDAGRALTGYRLARRAYAALPDPRMEAHACASEVRCQLAAGQAPDADLLRHAWRTFNGLGAVWDANRLKQLMRVAGLPVPHRRGRPGYGNQLSPREREIADLAASGHTNRDIAANLYLSDRTVKYHLANAMRKLGVSSRRHLRDVLESGSATNASAENHRDHTCRCARCGQELNPS